MITFITSTLGEVDINPSFVAAVCQPTVPAGDPRRLPITHIILSNGLTYTIPMPIDEVRKRLQTEYEAIGYLADAVQNLTTAIRNR